MRTLYTVLIGLALVWLFRLAGHALAGVTGQRNALMAFFPTWFVAMAANLFYGVQQRHGFSEELLFFMVNFGLPCLCAAFYLCKK